MYGFQTHLQTSAHTPGAACRNMSSSSWARAVCTSKKRVRFAWIQSIKSQFKTGELHPTTRMQFSQSKAKEHYLILGWRTRASVCAA